jgi:putative colanic acid biosysnthesis UDP-glucose lipid carrier transferase
VGALTNRIRGNLSREGGPAAHLRELPAKGLLRGHEELLCGLQRCADLVWIGLGHYLAGLIFGQRWGNAMTVATVGAMLVFNLAAEWRGLYRPWRSEPLRRELRVAVTTWLVAPLTLLVIDLALGVLAPPLAAAFSPRVTLTWFVLVAMLLASWRVGCRLALRFLRARGRNSRTVAVMGATPIAEALCVQIAERPWLGMRMAGVYDERSADRRHTFRQIDVPFVGSLAELLRDAREGRIDIVYIGLPLRAESRISELLEALADTTATVYLTADFATYDLLSARWHQIGNVPLVSIHDSPFSGPAAWLKRLEDVVLGSMILALIALPMLLIALGVKITSRGPVFFRQRRFGLNGRSIRVLKFRSMTVCEDGDVIKQATKNDSRVTRFGAFLRRTSLDELPQFLQVISGEMSIVGPRPHAVAHNEAYRSLIRRYMLRHKVKPGITGWAQVNGFRGETDTLDKMEQRVRFDLEYITDWYLGWDLKIIFLTVFGSRKNHGAY